MSIFYIKKAEKTAQTGETETRKIVSTMLDDIERGGEEKAKEYAKNLDKYTGNIVVSAEQIEQATKELSQKMRDDIQFSYDRVRTFAEKQRVTLTDFEVELSPGLFAGQKQIPVKTAGCYIPGGRYSHIASAVMSVATAKAAGVDNVIACSPTRIGGGVNPAILYTANLCGADTILALGGVQGIAAMTFGLFTGYSADILVGPGNKFVAEAKRMLYGRVGIDLFAGPTEIGIIADGSADPEVVALDLVGQAEHGLDSPCWLITTDKELGNTVLGLMPQYIEKLPEDAKKAAEASWRDYGEIVYCSTNEEALQVSDDYAPEHLEVQAENLSFWQANLRNYGSLFVGEEATVAFGDKCSGTNHILPTKGAGRYTGGLSVGKFIKTVTTQRMSKEACKSVASVTARISRLEGMEAHARTGDDRLKKYFPDESFSLNYDNE